MPKMTLQLDVNPTTLTLIAKFLEEMTALEPRNPIMTIETLPVVNNVTNITTPTVALTEGEGTDKTAEEIKALEAKTAADAKAKTAADAKKAAAAKKTADEAQKALDSAAKVKATTPPTTKTAAPTTSTDLRAVAAQLVAKDQASLIAVLAKYGAGKLGEVKPEDYEAIMVDLKEAVNG